MLNAKDMLFCMNKNFSSKCLFLLRIRKKNVTSLVKFTLLLALVHTHTNQLVTKSYNSWSFIAYNIFNIISFIRERLNQTRSVLSECDVKYNVIELSQKRNPKCFIFTQANQTYNCNLFSTYCRIIDHFLLKNNLYIQ